MQTSLPPRTTYPVCPTELLPSGGRSERPVLIVGQEESARQTLSKALRHWGYRALEKASAAEALTSLESEHPAAVILDLSSANGSLPDLLHQIRRREPDAGIIVAGVPSDDILDAVRDGADDFISKPINFRELEVRIRRRIESRTETKDSAPAGNFQGPKFAFNQIIGRSPVMRETLRLARRVAESEVSSVLLQGESGTGKDMIAKAIHYASQRGGQPFIAINCAALPANLVESELFGHEKGAFTDAKARKVGLLEMASGGTILLDEISELDLNLQAKLLRVLEEGSFRRVGGIKEVPFDARVIAASNRDLKRETEARRFRLDLYYRLAVIEIGLPRLSERGDDVLLLAEHFLALYTQQRRRKISGLTPETTGAFRLYSWPGNVRELRNVIERAMILEDGHLISTRFLPRDVVAGAEDNLHHRVKVIDADGTVSLPPQGLSLEKVETLLVKRALEQANGNQTRAADLLGLTRDQFRYRLKKLRETESGQPAPPRAAAA